ncbi:FAD-dependent monooxygenase [Alteromonas facilis]|uniref:FAD-dependent monooxygenase n=1 Tax=Alteromonas facilis TaxID=2048004 RepID=UPI0013DA7F1D|nr:FAD-dependent monooxygenase [Alteromonas facilis]
MAKTRSLQQHSDVQHNVPRVDVTIVGAGIVGVSLALALHKYTDLSVALIEPHAIKHDSHPAFDSRSLALGATTFSYLLDLVSDIPHTLTRVNCCSIEHIQVSDRGFAGKCFLSADDFATDHLGVVAPLQLLGRNLLQALEHNIDSNDGRVSLYCPSEISSIVSHEQGHSLSLNTGETLQTKLLVLADGGRSPFKSQLGFCDHHQDYGQDAIIANVVFNQPHEHWAYERFTAQGPVALLPLEFSETDDKSGGYYSLVWTVDRQNSDYNQRLMNDETFFRRELEGMVGHHHGRCIRVGKRDSYPLSLRYSETVHQHRSVVIGNAAQTLHPIAGQGFNLGLRDVMDLVSILNETPSEQLADWRCMSSYADKRDADRKLIMNSTDTLVRCFSNLYWPFVVGRNIGLTAMNMMSPMKQAFARRAMGYRFD